MPGFAHPQQQYPAPILIKSEAKGAGELSIIYCFAMMSGSSPVG
jgi:hypothetical protein